MLTILIIVMLFLTACSNLSPAIKNAPKMDLQFEQVQQNFGYYQGSPVRWGGTVIEVENNNDSSRIQILSYPLNYYGRPQIKKKHQGRFVIQSKEFLDPAVYKKDAEITVAGTLYGQIKQTVGKKILKLPLGRRVWRVARQCRAGRTRLTVHRPSRCCHCRGTAPRARDAGAVPAPLSRACPPPARGRVQR